MDERELERELETRLLESLKNVKDVMHANQYDPRIDASAYAAGLMLYSHRRLTRATCALVVATAALVLATVVLAVVTLLRR
jgi:hypothetical protein